MKERFDLYFQLIQQLLACHQEEQSKLLQANVNLIDLGFLYAMQLVANDFAEKDDSDGALFLQNLAQWLVQQMGFNSFDEMYQQYLDFLMKILQAVEKNPTAEVIYPLLSSNIEKLNLNLGFVLSTWAQETLLALESKKAKSIADIIGYFSYLVQQFPFGNIADNQELAIIANLETLIVFTETDFPHDWARTLNNLGGFYRDRIKGDKAKNLELAIACCENALRVRTETNFPVQWAIAQYNLANAYKDRIEGDHTENLEQAILLYQNALRVYTKNDFSTQWADSHHNLGLAYIKRIEDDRGDNLELAILCFKKALYIRTKTKFPYEWADIQHDLGGAYFFRTKGDKSTNLESAISCFENALDIFAETKSPLKWAMAQYNLANSYKERTEGDRATNLELAIKHFENALRFRTETNFPYEWADIQNNLAVAYQNRIEGKQTENIERAIIAYENALRVYTETKHSQKWGYINSKLGLLYFDKLKKGNRAENLEYSIINYTNALRIYTEATFPYEWANIQGNLAAIYKERIQGNRAENLELSITACKNALRLYTEANFPYEWADIQNKLGCVYCDRIKGDSAKNLEESIFSYKNALRVYTETDYPYEWATTQSNLSITYENRIKNKSENLESAIAACENALRILTETDFPYDWANVHNNLANAYSKRIQGDNAENIEQSISSYKNALRIYTETKFPVQWANVHNNLAIAYGKRIKGDDAENIEYSIYHNKNALRIYTETDFPVRWARTQVNLGSIYNNKSLKNWTTENIEQAITAYHNALRIYTEPDFPIDCLRTAKNLGDLYFNQGNWQLAIQNYQKAISAIEITRNWATNDLRRQEIIVESMDVYEKMIQACINNGQLELAMETTERSRSRHLVDLMASNDVYQGGNIPEAIKEYLEQYEHLQERINLLRSSSQASDNRELASSEKGWRNRETLSAENAKITQLETEKQQIWLQLRGLDPILAGQKQVEPISFTQIQQLVDNNSTAILCFYSTRQDTHIFIIYKNRAPQVHTCIGQKIVTLHGEFLGDNWLSPYLRDFSTWQQNISQVLAELAQRLQLDRLIERYFNGIEELIIIPHVWLHQIPFAALPVNSISSAFPSEKVIDTLKTDSMPLESFFKSGTDSRGMGGKTKKKKNVTFIPENRQYLGDLFRLRILPSCQILNYCHQRPNLLQQTTMGIVENATGDLPYTVYECETLTNQYQVESDRRLQQSRATINQYRRIASEVPILHSSHHGSANLNNSSEYNPLESALILSDGNLTLGELLTPGWRNDLQNLSDVYLNNCETNFSINEITDDLLSIATGFLCAGARSVVSTLWSVDDCASALLAIFYYEYRKLNSSEADFSRSLALQQAQKKLRTLTGKQLHDEYLKSLNSNLNQQYQQAIANAQATQNSEEREKYQQLANKIQRQIQNTLPNHCKQEYPFANPYYWAGFISQGMA